MKWPKMLTLVRHDTSEYNVLKDKKDKHDAYSAFIKEYDKDPYSQKIKELAVKLRKELALNKADHDTPLAEGEGYKAIETGKKLRELIELPDVIFVSPYLRTHLTLQGLMEGWTELKGVRIVEEERIRERDYGLSILYNDWRIFNVCHPEQIELRKIIGSYWYRFPQGENIPDLRERIRSWFGTLIRDYSDKKVLAVTHQMSILALKANLDRLNADQFIELDRNEKLHNCGVTIYEGDPEKGKEGKLVLRQYNSKLYSK